MMRTTVTLDDDTEALLRRAMQRRGVTFKQALNDAVRAGVAEGRSETAPPPTRAHAMGEPLVDVERALRLAAEDEDEEILRRLRLGQ